MRAAARLLAIVKPVRYLEPGNPTGLTGLTTHPTPRSTLLYLYTSTLDKLKQIPETSVYRQSTEALTKHRLSIVEKVKPEGWDTWHERVTKRIEERASVLEKQGLGIRHQAGKYNFVTIRPQDDVDERVEEWDGEAVEELLEGPDRTAEQAREQPKALGEGKLSDANAIDDAMKIELEPRLSLAQYVSLFNGNQVIPPATLCLNHTVRCNLATTDGLLRVQQIENEIAAGLIEEVIQVAEGEHLLVDKMVEAKA